MRSAFGMALLLLIGVGPASWGHFNMLIPDKHSIKKGETVTFTYQWGHPFEHQLFDAPAPENIVVYPPQGAKIDLSKSLEKIAVPGVDGKKVTAYRFPFTPEQRGDYTFVLQTRPIWMEEEKMFLQDTVKVVLHVQAQNGWDRATAAPAHDNLTPLTRPYGLLPGMVFRAEALDGSRKSDRAAAGRSVEIERYNPAPPKQLPPEEHITYLARTDRTGVAAFTLPEPGWWSMTVTFGTDALKHEDKEYPRHRRITLWVPVDEKVNVKPNK